MKLKIVIDLNNDAFKAPNGDGERELAAILRKLADCFERLGTDEHTSRKVFDSNGNTVGTAVTA